MEALNEKAASQSQYEILNNTYYFAGKSVAPNKLTERYYMYNQSWSQLGSL